MIRIDREKCTGCKLCEKACPHNAITILNRKAEIDLTTCTFCGICVDSCFKERAITLELNNNKDINKLKQYNGISVFIEILKNEIHPISIEILGEARRLAESNNLEVTALLIADFINTDIKTLFHYGADNVVYYKSPDYTYFRNELFTEIAVDFINNNKPSIFLAGATSIGRSFIPKVAAQVKTGLTADCTKLELVKHESLLLGTRPAFGGNLMATIICEDTRPQFATVRHHVMKPIEPDVSRNGKIAIIDNFLVGSNPLSMILEVVEENCSSISITEAELIVAGGYGIGSKENFRFIEELADLIGGTFAASRSAVDSGWAPYSHQVGQTGKTVNPKLYLAFGISGAIQHIAGMQSSDYIIAVNSDPDAEIFKYADIGLCGDALEILPNLIKALKKKI